MAFNHYAKIKRILDHEPAGWYVQRIDQPTQAKTFSGEIVSYDHYYRIYNHTGEEIKYCKFQKIDKLASILRISIENLPIVSE